MKSQPEPAPRCHSPAGEGPVVVQPHKRRILNRLRRVEGQLQGVLKMVEDDRYCVEILTQVSAVQSALRSAAAEILEDHTRGCVQRAILSGKGEAEISELLNLVRGFGR